MGFGAGLRSEGRRVAILGDGERAGWTAQRVALSSTFSQVLVVTPSGTPAARDLQARDDDHAFLLVTSTRMPDQVVYTARTVLGDARDLLLRVLRRAMGTALPPVEHLDTLSAAQLSDARVLCVHVGATDFARGMLRDLRRGQGGWDGAPEALDGDGFALLCARRSTPSATHLVIVGGSDYGTFFGVATFLEEVAGALWLHPGDAGEVVASGSALASTAPLDRIEEPTVRSRSFTQMSTAHFTAAEVDAMRTWQLCNRLRPVTDRLVLYLQRVGQRQPGFDPNFDRPNDPDPFVYAMLESEARFPADHSMRNLLSPFLPPMLTEMGMATGGPLEGRYRLEGMIWPDLRPRVPAAGTPTFTETQRGMVSRFVGTVPPNPAYGGQDLLCSTAPPSPSEMRCPEFQPYDQNTGRPSLTARVARRLSTTDETTGGDVKSMCGYRNERTPGAASDSIYRFFPLTWRHRLEGDQFPINGWHPCVFAFDAELPYGLPLTVHPHLAIDLGNQVRFGMLGRQRRYGEATHPLAFDDGDNWCNCDACVRSDPTGVDGNYLFHRGHLIATAWTRVEAAGLNAAGVSGTARFTEDLRGSGGVLFQTTAWNRNVEANPFADMTVDELTLRGVVGSGASPSARSRRVLGLLNAVCAEATDPDVRLFEHAPPASPQVVTVPKVSTEIDLLWPPLRSPVITFFAYLNYLAPPILSPDREDVNETCHPHLMPYVVGTRDTDEYADPGAALEANAAVRPAGALSRAARWPQQFNMERWVYAGARQMGLYEYVYSALLAVPRNYAARLGNALRWGRRFSIRGYVAEVQPAFAIEGPMLWETARLLWDPSAEPTTTGGSPRSPGPIRRQYCERAFRAGRDAMADFLAVCEGAWAATRDRWTRYHGATSVAAPDRRDNPMVVANYFGRGMAGRAGWLSQLDGWYQPSVRGNARDALTDAWVLLREAAMATASDPAASARVRWLREGFGLTMLIALWYQPLHQAFDEIRRATNATLFQYVAQLFTGSAGPGVAQYVTMRASASPLSDITVDRTDIVRNPTLSPLPSVALSSTAVRGRTLIDRIRQCIGTPRESGIRQLRLRVHQYLARRNASVMPPYFSAADTAVYSDAPLGFGLFEGASALELSAGDGMWIPRAAPSGSARLAGLNLPMVEDYRKWWLEARTLSVGKGFRQRRDLDTDFIVRNKDAAGLGWMFTGIKQMAAVVLLYGQGVATDGRDLQDRKFAIMNG